jgi:hypothetical protein
LSGRGGVSEWNLRKEPKLGIELNLEGLEGKRWKPSERAEGWDG